MDFIPMLGTIAGIVSTLSFLPQVFKIWRTQSTKDISLGMYSLYSLGLLLWGLYALMKDFCIKRLFLMEIEI